MCLRFFFFSKDKHCYDEPDVIPALHIHYSHKPICGIDFMQICPGICINKVLINTSEETSILFDTKVFLIMKGKVRCPQVKLNKWIAIKKHGEFCTPDLLFLCVGIIIKIMHLMYDLLWSFLIGWLLDSLLLTLFKWNTSLRV